MKAYERLGVKPVINAAGSITKFGGTRTRPEVLELMTGAARIMVNVDELNRRAGEEIARLTGAEAGFVCSGAAGGLVLQAAACIAGKDPVKMRQLPDTTGMKDEIIIQNMHRFPYEQAFRSGPRGETARHGALLQIHEEADSDREHFPRLLACRRWPTLHHREELLAHVPVSMVDGALQR